MDIVTSLNYKVVVPFLPSADPGLAYLPNLGPTVMMGPYAYPLQEKVIKHLSYIYDRSGIKSEVVNSTT